jgi:hypothetical protein
VSTIVGVRLGEHHEDGRAARPQDDRRPEVEEVVQA